MRSLRGKVVVLSFNDPKCTTICPLTTTALLHAKQLLGPAASQVALVGVGANPEATQVKWVRDYSRLHGMLHKWRFLTGSLPELRRVWRAYYIEAAVMNGSVDHTPATYVIGPAGRATRLYQTAMAVAPVPNQRHYDTIYQERYMGLPSDNVEGYRNGSPIHFAKQLKGNLLIVHGTGGRRKRSPRSRLGGASRPLLRHVGDGGHEPGRAARGAQPLPGHGKA